MPNGDERLWSTDFSCTTSSDSSRNIVRTTTFFVNVIDPYELSVIADPSPTYPNCQSNVTLSWNSIPGVSGYIINRMLTTNGENYIYRVNAPNVTRVQTTDNTNLLSGASYRYTVSGIFPESSPVGTPPVVPPTPTSVSSGVFVTAPKVSTQCCLPTLSDFVINTVGLTINVDPTLDKKGSIKVDVVKTGGVDKNVVDIYLIPSKTTPVLGVWKIPDPSMYPLNTARIENGHNRCSSIDSLGKCKFEYEYTITKDTVSFEDPSIIVRAFTQENNNSAVVSRDQNTFLTITRSIAGDIKMWLENVKDKNDYSLSKIKIKKGEDVPLSWEFLNNASFVKCRGFIKHNDTSILLDDFPEDINIKKYKILSPRLVSGVYDYSMKCDNSLVAPKSANAFVFNGLTPTNINKLTITVTNSELKEE